MHGSKFGWLEDALFGALISSIWVLGTAVLELRDGSFCDWGKVCGYNDSCFASIPSSSSSLLNSETLFVPPFASLASCV